LFSAFKAWNPKPQITEYQDTEAEIAGDLETPLAAYQHQTHKLLDTDTAAA
jgi:hypothetical protein